jgi:iron complex outermembrane receptor protein
MDGEWASAQNRINDEFGESATPSYALLHLRAFKTWKIGKNELEAGFGVENLFDATYQEHLDWGDIDRPGRSFVMSFNWQLQ